jgi:hypothetical protein
MGRITGESLAQEPGKNLTTGNHVTVIKCMPRGAEVGQTLNCINVAARIARCSKQKPTRKPRLLAGQSKFEQISLFLPACNFVIDGGSRSKSSS